MKTEPLRVVVFEEADSRGRAIWVAQALEVDMAAQAGLGEDRSAAITALGALFDARDAILTREPNVEPLPPAPPEYARMWEVGSPIGSFQLGVSRQAVCRELSRAQTPGEEDWVVDVGRVETVRVVVFEEADSEGRTIWVAQGLEADLGAEAGLGEDRAAAITALGVAFDESNAILVEAARRSALVPAPVEYVEMWEVGTPIGSWRLGATRRADCRVAATVKVLPRRAQNDAPRVSDGGRARFRSGHDSEGRPVISMTLTQAPTERIKAASRLMVAAYEIAAFSLQQNARMVAVVDDVNDLSFRRDAGKLDLSKTIDDGALDRVHQRLLDAAIAFAAADAAEKAENAEKST